MPRKPRTPKVTEAAQAESTALAIFEQAAAELQPLSAAEIVAQVAEATRMPESTRTVEPVDDRPKLRTTLTYNVGNGDRVSMVDDGNRGGLGIVFDLNGEKPSQHVLETVKADRTYGGAVKRGMSWKGGQWRKQVSDNPVGDRLEVEGRVKGAAERILEERRQKAEQGFDRF